MGHIEWRALGLLCLLVYVVPYTIGRAHLYRSWHYGEWVWWVCFLADLTLAGSFLWCWRKANQVQDENP